MLAEATAVLQELLEVDRVLVVRVCIDIAVGISSMPETVEGIVGVGGLVMTAIDASVERGGQSLGEGEVCKSVERERGVHHPCGIEHGIGDTVVLGEVGTHISAAQYLAIAVIAHRPILVAEDIALAIAQIHGIDGTYLGYLRVDVGTSVVLSVVDIGTVVGGGAGKVDVAAHVDPLGGLVGGLQTGGVALIV